MIKGTKKRNNKRILFLTIGAIVVAVFVLFQLKTKTGSQENALPQNTKIKEFQSDFLGFKVSLPEQFQATEKYNDVILSTTLGKITISSTGTNFEDLSGYVVDLESKNNFFLEDKNFQKDGILSLISGVIKDNAGDLEYIYFIYPEGTWAVYSLSTNSPDLYDDLDQIAKSFEYLGE